MKMHFINSLLIFTVLVVWGCGDNASTSLIPPDDPLPSTQQQSFTQRLTSGSWNVGQDGTVSRDNVDVSDQFPEFVITFKDDFTYSSSGGGDLWPDGNGTWQFVSESGIDRILVGGVEMASTVSATQLSLIFSINDPEGAIQGRIADLTGEYTIMVIR